MVGMLLWKSPEPGKKQKPVVLKERMVLHMRFACGEIVRGPRTPEAVLRRRVQSAAKRLRQNGVIRIVTPEEFPYGDLLEKQGIRAVSTLALRRGLASELVRWELTRQGLTPGGVKIAVSGDQLTGELVRTVTELALRYRYVLLDLPYGGEDLCRQLRREYGVSLLMGPSKEQLEETEALLLFSERTDLRRRNPVVVPLYEGADLPLPPLMLPPALEEQLPQGLDRPQLLAALQEAGAIRRGQITVGAGDPAETASL